MIRRLLIYSAKCNDDNDMIGIENRMIKTTLKVMIIVTIMILVSTTASNSNSNNNIINKTGYISDDVNKYKNKNYGKGQILKLIQC